MRTLKAFLAVFLSVVSLSGACESVRPTARTLADEMRASWLVNVNGEGRTRTLKISGVTPREEGVFGIDAVYGWTDGNLTHVNAEIVLTETGIRLIFITQTDSKIVAFKKQDGLFEGSFTDKAGRTKGVTIEKLSEQAMHSRVEEARLGTTKRAADMLKKPAPDVPPGCASFAGLWRGTWGTNPERWLLIAEVDSKCQAKFAYIPNNSVPGNLRLADIRAGILSFPADSGHAYDFKLNEDELEAVYYHPSRKSVSTKFRRMR